MSSKTNLSQTEAIEKFSNTLSKIPEIQDEFGEDIDPWLESLNSFIILLMTAERSKYIIIGTPNHGFEIFPILNSLKYIFKDSDVGEILKDVVVFTEDYNYSTTFKHFNMDHLIYQANPVLYYKMLSKDTGFRLEITKTVWPYIIFETVKKFHLDDKIKIISVGHDHLIEIREINGVIEPLQTSFNNPYVGEINVYENDNPSFFKIENPIMSDEYTVIDFIDKEEKYINYDISYLNGLNLFDDDYIYSHGFNPKDVEHLDAKLHISPEKYVQYEEGEMEKEDESEKKVESKRMGEGKRREVKLLKPSHNKKKVKIPRHKTKKVKIPRRKTKKVKIPRRKTKKVKIPTRKTKKVKIPRRKTKKVKTIKYNYKF